MPIPSARLHFTLKGEATCSLMKTERPVCTPHRNALVLYFCGLLSCCWITRALPIHSAALLVTLFSVVWGSPLTSPGSFLLSEWSWQRVLKSGTVSEVNRRIFFIFRLCPCLQPDRKRGHSYWRWHGGSFSISREHGINELFCHMVDSCPLGLRVQPFRRKSELTWTNKENTDQFDGTYVVGRKPTDPKNEKATAAVNALLVAMLTAERDATAYASN